jgi:hypothetical protein
VPSFTPMAQSRTEAVTHGGRVPRAWAGSTMKADDVSAGRYSARLMYHNDRVLRVKVVIHSVGSFVEWVDR